MGILTLSRAHSITCTHSLQYVIIPQACRLQSLKAMNLDESKLILLASACKSNVALCQLKASGLPAMLAQAICEFCNQQMIAVMTFVQAAHERGDDNDDNDDEGRASGSADDGHSRSRVSQGRWWGWEDWA